MDQIKLLLVDDEREFAATLAERFELRDLDTRVADDGETALEMMERERFDVVVLDLKMPGIGGMETLRRIRDDYDIPVILLTGHGSVRDGMEGMRLGAFDYMMKPVEFEDLLAKIARAVGKNLG